MTVFWLFTISNVLIFKELAKEETPGKSSVISRFKLSLVTAHKNAKIRSRK